MVYICVPQNTHARNMRVPKAFQRSHIPLAPYITTGARYANALRTAHPPNRTPIDAKKKGRPVFVCCLRSLIHY